MINTRLSWVLLLTVVTIQGCVSSGPKTQYFSLMSADKPALVDGASDVGSTLIGVGPIILPEYLDRPAIVSFTDTNQLRISGHRAWAGDLKENISRVVAVNLSQMWNANSVIAFPWDNRARPTRQIRIVIEEFGGQLGSEVVLKGRWSVFDTQRAEVIFSTVESLQVTAANDNYNAYVAALNELINQFSQKIAQAYINFNLVELGAQDS